MKGLVFKDLLLMKKMNKKVIFVMYFFVIAISFFGENEVYSIMSSAFFSLFIGIENKNNNDDKNRIKLMLNFAVLLMIN